LVPTGNIGNQVLQFSSQEDQLMGMIVATAGAELRVMTNQNRLLELLIDRVLIMGKEGVGEPVLELATAEELVGWQVPSDLD
jgi:DNA gyrase/topoisomerase IV subunit A